MKAVQIRLAALGPGLKFAERALTPWFPGHARPARHGVYQRRSGAVRTFSRWDGAQWHMSCQSAAGAARGGLPPSMNQRAEWRGLVEQAAP